MRSFLVEFWQFIKTRKLYWMMPLIFVLLLLGSLLLVSAGSALAPFIYSIF